MEMKCIFNIGKNISILAKITQVSDVAHGPLVHMWVEDKRWKTPILILRLVGQRSMLIKTGNVIIV
jgi:hypothetical protein